MKRRSDPIEVILEKYVRGSVPPPGMASVRERIEARLDTPTGRYDLQELELAMKTQITEAALLTVKEQLQESTKARVRTTDRIWALIVVILGAIIAGLLAKSGLK
jgi:hypothetical protein